MSTNFAKTLVWKQDYDVILWRHKQRTPNTNNYPMPLNETPPMKSFCVRHCRQPLVFKQVKTFLAPLNLTAPPKCLVCIRHCNKCSLFDSSSCLWLRCKLFVSIDISNSSCETSCSKLEMPKSYLTYVKITFRLNQLFWSKSDYIGKRDYEDTRMCRTIFEFAATKVREIQFP